MITINPATFVIDIPQSYLTLVSGTLYKADTNQIRKDLKTIEMSEEFIVFPDTHVHNTTVELFGVIYARTIEIISPYSVTFTPDAQWSVRLDGSNNNIGDIAAGILNQNQVQVIPTNSAGLQDLSTLLAAAYQGAVVINTSTGLPGTTTPVGTYLQPSNNMIDAKQIGDNNGIQHFILGSNLEIVEDLNDGKANIFIGVSPYIVLTANPIADLTGAAIQNLTVTGELDGLNSLYQCNVNGVTNVSGFIKECAFISTVSFNGNVLITQSYSNVTGGGFPSFIGIAGSTIEVRDWHGSLEAQGIVDGDHTFEGYGGRFLVNANCTGGTVYVRGAWFEIVDNSGVGCTVLDQREVVAVWNADKNDYVIPDSMGEKQGGALTEDGYIELKTGLE